VLGDLEKGDVTDTAARASLVKSLAAKTPVWACYPNVLHVALAANELLGSPVEMRHAPIVGGGRRVQTESGLGTIFEPSPEDRAKDRWHQGLFEEAEYELARQWRTTLASNHAAMQGLISGSPTRFTFRDLSAVKMKTDAMIDRGTRLTTLKVALASALPAEYHSHVLQRWKEAGGPPLREFAPYNAHILSVDLFRFLAMGSGLINPQEPSNYVDLAYLYYIPFCQIFISSDRLHRNCIPLFMDKVKQAFVWGHDLRPELAQLVAKYSAHPDIEERGLVGVASDTVFETGTTRSVAQAFARGRSQIG
jgi:hypothetical protein